MQKKFEDLFYEFTPEKSGKDWLSPDQIFFRGTKDMPGATMHCGFQVVTGPAVLLDQPICHTFNAHMVFLGATFPDVFKSFDAEIHFYMGKTLDTMEKIVITEPTILKIPKGYWHGPLKIVRVGKPLYYQKVLFNGEADYLQLIEENGKTRYLYMPEPERSDTDFYLSGYKSVPWTVINEDGIDRYSEDGSYDDTKAPDSRQCVVRPGYTTNTYTEASTLIAEKPALKPETAKMVLAVPREETQWGPWCPSPQAYFRGDIYMEDSFYNVGFQVFTAANNMEDPHFHQAVDEYIFFISADPTKPEEFDAEIEFMIGDDPDHMESRMITKPTVVRLPPNVWHCPIKFRKMNKPLIFQAAFLNGTWGTIVRKKNTAQEASPFFNREYVYEYMGDNVRFCKFNKQKRCNICGACFPKMDEIDFDKLDEEEKKKHAEAPQGDA